MKYAHEILVEYSDRRNPRYAEKTLSQRHLIRHKFHVGYSVVKPRYPPLIRQACNCLRHGTAIGCCIKLSISHVYGTERLLLLRP